MTANGPTDHSRASCEVCDAASPKYAFSDDFSEISAAQTLTVYQHATRTGSFAEHLEARIDDLAHYRRLPRENLLALRRRRVSPHASIFALADPHRAEILGRLRMMLAGPWGRSFDLARSD